MVDVVIRGMNAMLFGCFIGLLLAITFYRRHRGDGTQRLTGSVAPRVIGLMLAGYLFDGFAAFHSSLFDGVAGCTGLAVLYLLRGWWAPADAAGAAARLLAFPGRLAARESRHRIERVVKIARRTGADSGPGGEPDASYLRNRALQVISRDRAVGDVAAGSANPTARSTRKAA